MLTKCVHISAVIKPEVVEMKEIRLLGRTSTVSGQQCTRGTRCKEDSTGGYWYCDTDSRGAWDYCCRPDKRCAATAGNPSPWYSEYSYLACFNHHLEKII